MSVVDGRLAVFGDAWITLLAEYVSSAEAHDFFAAKRALPTFDQTSVDFMHQDGAYVAFSLMRTLLDDERRAEFPSQRFSQDLNRLITVRPFPALKKSGNGGDSSRPVKRIDSVRYLQNVTLSKHAFNSELFPPDHADLHKRATEYQAALIIDDAGDWRKDGAGLELIEDSIHSKVFVVLGSDLPDLAEDNSEFQATAWRILAERDFEVFAVMSANLLRHGRAHISRRLSWDSTVEQLCFELQADPHLRFLHKHANLIIRFGMSAAVFIRRDSCEGAHLVYDSDLPNRTQRDLRRNGSVCGKCTMLATGILKHFLESDGHASESECLTRGIKLGLDLIWKRFERGYLQGFEHPPSKLVYDHAKDIKQEIFGAPLFKRGAHKPSSNFSVCALPSTDWNRLKAGWTILESVVPSNPQPKGLSRINLAEAIVLAGVPLVLNRETAYEPSIKEVLTRDVFRSESLDLEVGTAVPNDTTLEKASFDGSARIDVPVLRIGEFTSIERNEIECIRGVRNLITEYIERGESSDRIPLSIAVFGKPGAGKSFVVKQIAEDLKARATDGARPEIRLREHNLAQFCDSQDLASVISEIRDDNIRGRLPIVFLDEFDTRFEGAALGWLKYLLGPMQDGVFRGRAGNQETGRAVFIFAGGTEWSFARFAEERFRKAKAQRAFRKAKGPDFVSRLRGFIDVASINAEKAYGDHSDPPKKPYVKPVIRRAMLLRSLLEGKKGRLRRGKNGIEHALIDEDVVFALLTINCYRHETRSMQAIIEMCTPLQGRITKTSLPSDDQLSMHVDAQEFHKRMERSRERGAVWPR